MLNLIFSGNIRNLIQITYWILKIMERPYAFPEQQMTNYKSDPKVMEFIEKNSQLIDSGNQYEFSLKIKSLAKMRISRKRQQQGQLILLAGFDTLVKNQKVKPLALKDILTGLISIYSEHPQLLTKASQKRFLHLLFHRQWIVQDDIDSLKKMVVKCGTPSDHPFISKAIVDFQASHGIFSAGQKFAANLSEEVAIQFVDKWTKDQKTTKQEIPALWCRMVLARAILIDIEEGQKLFKKVRQNFQNDNAFLVFTGFLLKTVRLQSKDAYEVIEQSYCEFLQSDGVFRGLYRNFGQKYFGVEKSKGGLLGLLH